jgi:Ca2+/Na+ antiporter
MNISPIEIGLIIIVFLLVTVIFRLARVIRRPVNKKLASSGTSEKQHEEKQERRNYTGIIGLGLILVSIILLWSGMRLLAWAFWSYSWFLVLAVIGLLLLILPRRR